MEKEITILKNITREGPGILEEVIKDEGLNHSIYDLSLNQKPASLRNTAALIVLGGPDSANDLSTKMHNELTLIREALFSGIPYMGICLGMQTLVKAAGGEVVKCKYPEVGFRDLNDILYSVELTEEGTKDQLFEGLGHSFNIFQLHGETVVLNDNVKLLAKGRDCQNQIVKISNNAYGIQCHFELTDELFELWLNEDHDLKKLDKKKLKSDFLIFKEKYKQTGQTLFRNFLRIAGMIADS